MWIQSLSPEDPLEEDMATCCSSLAWRTPMDRGAGQGYSSWMGSQSATGLTRLSTQILPLKAVPLSLSLLAESCPTLATPWIVAHQAALSVGFSRQEYRSGLPFPSPGDLPDLGTKPRSPALQTVFTNWAILPGVLGALGLCLFAAALGENTHIPGGIFPGSSRGTAPIPPRGPTVLQ